MKAIKIMATIDEQGKLSLDQPLTLNKNQRVEVIVLIPETADLEEDESKATILEDFRQAWQEAMTGKTIPVAQIWEGIEDE
ncbi:hypothetical protein [Limnoraphis robusta]|uniref:DUF104 domain-containing protein n=1 Tax=Limnoraphis robusta CCNP1315 TaxID=3110306 RepID=A0ABU5TS39_9CYAN|nr:hypothetical protein [Limnoraphis robusta]MEA5517679.1 hypothetical protein [Limnoraphis robusta CCNP1315]MEA5548895.1 hypothetical protein [Limnoraphis robusta CCNP1324]